MSKTVTIYIYTQGEKMLGAEAIGKIAVCASWIGKEIKVRLDTAESQVEIIEALFNAQSEAYAIFKEKYPDLTREILNDDFLEKEISPEVLKLLTRREKVDFDYLVSRLPNGVILVSENALRNELIELFELIETELKKYSCLQTLITNRQTDQIHQDMKKLQEDLERLTNQLETQTENDGQINKTIDASTSPETRNESSKWVNDSSLPDSQGNINILLNRQLDRTKDLIGEGKINEAREILNSLESEISQSDTYTKFRWHTNIAACLINVDTHAAARHYFLAYDYCPTHEKAVANRIRAFLLNDQAKDALEFSTDSIRKHPSDETIWALHINARQLNGLVTDISDVPPAVRNTTGINHIFSELLLRAGDFKAAYEYAQKAYSMSPDSIQIKLTLLRAVLSVATDDSVRAYLGHISTEIKVELTKAVKVFGKPIQFLRTLQSEDLFTELAHYLAMAYDLLGDTETKASIIDFAYEQYPENLDLLWRKVTALREQHDYEGIKSLTKEKLSSLTTRALIILIEISDKQDSAWYQSIIAELDKRHLSDEERMQLCYEQAHYLWRTGDTKEAIKFLEADTSALDSNVALKTLHIRILDSHGELEKRDETISSLENQTCSDSSEIIQCADTLYDFGKYHAASKFYEKLIKSPGNDRLTKRQLISLLNSHQYQNAKILLESIPDAQRNDSDIRRIGINLYRKAGDNDALIALLEEELSFSPEDSSIATNYLVALHEMGQKDKLKEYLETFPQFNPTVIQHEFEVSKIERELGFDENALARMYMLFRSHNNNPEVAGCFLLTSMFAEVDQQKYDNSQVAVGAEVQFESNQDNKTIVIEPQNLNGTPTWFECIDENSDLAGKILGLKVGDSVDLGFGMKEAKIISIRSMYHFASDKAREIVEKSPNQEGPLWSVKVFNKAGEFEPSALLESAQSRRKRVDFIFEQYKKHSVPLEMLAKGLGTDIVTLMLDWPSNEHKMLVSDGITSDINKQKALLSQENIYVLDMTGLVELHRLNLAKELSACFGRKPLVSTSLYQLLKSIVHHYRTMKPSGTLLEVDGQIAIQEIAEDSIQQRIKTLEEMCAFVDDECEVVAAFGPENLSTDQLQINDVLSDITRDAFYLSLEHDAVLVSEDGVIRALSGTIGVKKTLWSQPLMMHLRESKAVSQEKYTEYVLDKVSRNHSFISVDANDLAFAASRSPTLVSNEARILIQTLCYESLDLKSGIIMVALFLSGITEFMDEQIVVDYYDLAFRALCENREDQKDLIYESLKYVLVAKLDSFPHSKSVKLFKAFGERLMPEALFIETILVKSIKSALYHS